VSGTGAIPSSCVVSEATQVNRPVPSATDFEYYCVGALLVIAWFARGRAVRFEDWWAAMARRRLLAMALCAAAPMLVRLAMLPRWPIPEPSAHDEFSLLLLADTLAHGRLANPTHPFWQHFETFHVFHQPTYASQYQPFNAVFMAAGQVIFGHPWWGVWCAVGLMCATICWMLQGWFPSRWALLGGILAGLRLAVFSYWMNSYWGGAPAAIGGALLLGALGRILKRRRSSDWAWLAIGAGILAGTRPYEGLVVCIPVGIIALSRGRSRALILFGVTLLVPLCILFCYNHVTTGSPFTMPYQVTSRVYGDTQILPFQYNPGIAHFRHNVMRRYYEEFELRNVQSFCTWSGFLRVSNNKLSILRLYLLGPLLSIPLAALLCSLKNQRTQPLLWIAGVAAVGYSLQSFFLAHYLAPVAPLVYGLVVQAIRRIHAVRPLAAWGILFACLASFAYNFTMDPRGNDGLNTWRCCVPRGNVDRAQVQSRLLAMGGTHLVLVEYGPTHDIHREWVYNGADIDHSKVVWARPIDLESDARLTRYFGERTVWRVRLEERPDFCPKVPCVTMERLR